MTELIEREGGARAGGEALRAERSSKARRRTAWPDDRPYPQSPVGMTPARWREVVDRYVAGEPILALKAAYGVSVSSIYRHAKLQVRRKRDVGAATLPKGRLR